MTIPKSIAEAKVGWEYPVLIDINAGKIKEKEE